MSKFAQFHDVSIRQGFGQFINYSAKYSFNYIVRERLVTGYAFYKIFFRISSTRNDAGMKGLFLSCILNIWRFV